MSEVEECHEEQVKIPDCETGEIVSRQDGQEQERVDGSETLSEANEESERVAQQADETKRKRERPKNLVNNRHMQHFSFSSFI